MLSPSSRAPSSRWSGRLPRWLIVLAVLLLLADALLMAGNLIFLLHDEPARESVHPVFSSLWWNGDNDDSWIELAGSLQLLAAVVLLALIWWRRRAGIDLMWALGLTALIVDDRLFVHERVGSWLVQTFDLPALFGFHPQYFGEGLVWAIAVPPLLIGLVIAHRRARGAARADSRHLWILLGALAVFTVLVDGIVTVAHRFAPPFVETMLVLLETGGELLMMTGMLFAVITAFVREASTLPAEPRSTLEPPPVR